MTFYSIEGIFSGWTEEEAINAWREWYNLVEDNPAEAEILRIEAIAKTNRMLCDARPEDGCGPY